MTASLPPTIVVGGGPAGSAVALLLVRAGVPVRLLERTRGPHDKVCGEFVSAEAIAILSRLGLDLGALGAVSIDRFGVLGRRGSLETPLPFPAAGLSRRVMDEGLLDLAAAAGVMVDRGVSVRAVEATSDGHCALLAGGRKVLARHVFIATGKHDLAGAQRPSGQPPNLIGLKMHFRYPQASTATVGNHRPGRVDLVPVGGGYAGFQPVADGVVNLCVLVDRDRFAALGGWDGLLAVLRAEVAGLDTALDGARPVWSKPVAIARIPYGFVRRQAAGLWWLGDQAAVIPSFSGDGMSIALHSAERAAASFLAGETPEAFQESFAEEVSGQVRRATWLSQLMVRPWFQDAASAAVRLAPSVARRIAVGTRVAAAMPDRS